jgi:hypothetical protein
MILAELEDDPRWERANPRSGDTLAKLAAAPTEYHAGKKNPRTRSRNIVKSPTTAEFRKSLVAAKASSFFSPREAYRQFKENPSYPSLRFKKVYPELRIYSAGIRNNYQALGQLDGDTVLWF